MQTKPIHDLETSTRTCPPGITDVSKIPVLRGFSQSTIANQKINNSSVSRNNRSLDIAASVQHVAENLLQPRQGRLAGNVVGGADLLGGDQAKGPAHRFRRVM